MAVHGSPCALPGSCLRQVMRPPSGHFPHGTVRVGCHSVQPVLDESQQLDLSVTVGGASFTGAGPADVVMAALERFSALVAEHGFAPPPASSVGEIQDDAGADAAQDEEPAATATPPRESAASKVPLPKFLESDKIKTNSEIATGIVVWAADHDGKPSISTGDIERYWKGTRLKVPANTSRDISKATRKGWLVKGDGNTHSASGYGREAIGMTAS